MKIAQKSVCALTDQLRSLHDFLNLTQFTTIQTIKSDISALALDRKL